MLLRPYDAAAGVRLHVDTTAYVFLVITGPPNGPVLYCSLASVGVCHLSFVVVCNTDGRRAGRPAGRRGAWPVGRPTLHNEPVVLRPVRSTPCFIYHDRRLQHS